MNRVDLRIERRTYNDIVVAIGGYDGSAAQTNVYFYPHVAGILPGVSPSSGSYTGGYPVVITGSNLCDGADIMNVTLCGVSAVSILSQSATQTVVVTGSGVPGVGPVRVFSTSYGITTKSNVFTYNPAITVVSGPHGAVAPSGVVDVAYGGSTSFVVNADAYYHIGSLLTNGVNVGAATNRPSYTSAWVNVTATGVLAVAFAEDLTSNTATPEWWLAQHGWTNNFAVAATNDADSDGLFNWQEYVAGTDPTNAVSRLSVSSVECQTSNGFVLDWPSVSNRIYGVDRATNLILPGFEFIATNLPATPPVNVYTDQVPGMDKAFYRIRVQKP